MNFFLIHCWGGDGRSCWSGWIADQLSRGSSPVPGSRFRVSKVLSPDFPNTNEPKLSEWLSEIRKHVKKFEKKDEWILIGHSLGCPTILRLLETFGNGEKIKVAILVAAFAKDLGVEETRDFVERDFDWKKIRQGCDKFIIINSDNDPYIELSEGERLTKLLGAELVVEPGGGHINEGSGFGPYPRLLKILTKLFLSGK